MPAASPEGLAVTASDVALKGPAEPLAGETESHLAEVLALNVRGVFERLLIARPCVAGALAPWTKLNVSAEGATVAAASPPVTFNSAGNGKSKSYTCPSNARWKAKSSVNWKSPAAVGVPLNSPLGVKEIPGGKLPPASVNL